MEAIALYERATERQPAPINALMNLAVLYEDMGEYARAEKCLRQEKLLRIEPVSDDAIAATARGGALATRVEDNGVHVVIAKSDDEAAELAQTYLRTAGRDIELRLDVRGRVLYVWEEAREPTPTQRQTMYDCWYE